MNYLCKYKNMFGEPREGMRKYRLFNLSIIDFALTFAAAYGGSRYFGQPFAAWTLGLLVASYFAHNLFCVDTTATMYINRHLKKRKLICK